MVQAPSQTREKKNEGNIQKLEVKYQNITDQEN